LRPEGVTVISLRPLAGALRKRLGSVVPDITALARDRWEVAPGTLRHVPPALFLPGQLERIRGTEFMSLEETLKIFRGGFDDWEGPTVAYRLRHVDLADSALFVPGAQRYLRSRRSRMPIYRTSREAIRGAMYESWNGNRWFGAWLSEDCLTYRLAESVGQPVTTAPVGELHGPAYERLLDVTPHRVETVHFDELILFDDVANNAGKGARALDLRDRLLKGRVQAEVPGVFLLRGQSGARRILRNEQDIADRFAQEYGFLVLDPMTSTVDELVAACGQARVIAGVEGSHLVHGVTMMPPDGLLLVIQPPERTLMYLKMLTDRVGQSFAFMVGEGGTDGFTADWSDIRRTLEMALERRN
jgi:hypothetical protein